MEEIMAEQNALIDEQAGIRVDWDRVSSDSTSRAMYEAGNLQPEDL